jgi:DNA-binding transcriptional LysR family regulator
VALRVGVLPDSRLIALQVGSVRRVTCAGPAYLAARGTPRTPDDLAGHDCIIYEGGLTPNAWRFVRDKKETTVAVQPRLIVSNVEAACDAARAGIGIARVFSHHVAAPIEAGTLVTVLEDFETKPLPVSLLYAAGRFLPIKVRAFLDFAMPRLKREIGLMPKLG